MVISISKLYRALWSAIDVRPWTYILRDIWHKYEGLCIMLLVTLGAIADRWLWPLVFWLLPAFALGYTAGHLFWGKEYIPNQAGEDK